VTLEAAAVKVDAAEKNTEYLMIHGASAVSKND